MNAYLVASSSPERVSELSVQLGANTSAPGVQHGIPEASAGPVVPADKGTSEPGSSSVLNVVVALVGNSEAVGGSAVLVVDNLGAQAILAEAVGGGAVAAVARGGHALHLVVLDEDDNVLPIVAVATEE